MTSPLKNPSIILEPTNNSTVKKRSRDLDANFRLWDSMLAGFVSTSFRSFVLQPFDVIKTKMIASNRAYGGITGTTLEIVKEDGVSSLWRGSFPTILRALPSSIVFFGMMSQLRKYFAIKKMEKLALTHPEITDPMQTIREKGFPLSEKFMISGGARVIATFFDNPLTVVKTNMESDAKKTFSDAAKQIYQTKGIAGFFSGVIPNIISVAPRSGLTYLFYSLSKEKLHELVEKDEDIARNMSKSKKLSNFMISSLIKLNSGALASILATMLTYPFENISTRMQLINSNSEKHKSNFVRVLKQMKQEKGGLFQNSFTGLSPKLFKIGLKGAVTWMSYELCLDLIQNLRNKDEERKNHKKHGGNGFMM